jgi:DNA-directed RNA polymerase subunit RPC12/RpoP
MTIRYTCTQCGSHLKIKDEKAGKPGHCPKCQAEFIIPQPEQVGVVGAGGASHDAPPAAAPEPSSLPEETGDESLSGTNEALDTVNIGSPPPSDMDITAPLESDGEAPAAEPMLVLEPDDDDLDAAPTLVQAQPQPVEKPDSRKKPSSRAFDPAAFLMEENDGTPATAKAPAPQRPNLDLLDRHLEQSRRSDAAIEADPTPAPPTKSPTTAAATEAWNHAKAAKQMMKAIKQSNAEALQNRDQPQGEGFDFVGAFKELGVKGLGGLALVLLGAMGLYYLSNMVMGGGPKLPPRGYVTGTVTLNGQPLSGVVVTFEPVERTFPGNEKERVRASVGTTDANGKYRMYYLDRHEGVALGQSMVYLSRMSEEGREMIPSDHLFGSMQMRDVAEGKQTYDFVLTTSK